MAVTVSEEDGAVFRNSDLLQSVSVQYRSCNFLSGFARTVLPSVILDITDGKESVFDRCRTYKGA